MPPVSKLLFSSICAGLMALSAPAWADVSRDDAAAAAQRATGGRVLSVDRAMAGNRPAWRVKLVTGKGEVRVILIDAATGQAM
jgi:uncharacterized membrane protein YkoI